MFKFKEPKALPLYYGGIVGLYPQIDSSQEVRGYRMVIVAAADELGPAQSLEFSNEQVSELFSLLWGAGYRPAGFEEDLTYLDKSCDEYEANKLTGRALMFRVHDVITRIS